MSLQILYTIQREPIGIYRKKASETFEGGNIGVLENEQGAGGYAEDPNDFRVVVAKASDPDATDQRVLGVIDDSTTGSGYGTELGDQLLSVDQSATVNFDTTLASNKVSLWMSSGIYATDQYDSGIDEATLITVGSPLYAGLTGILTDNTAGLSNSNVIAAFIEFTTSSALGIRVSPATPDKIWMVFKFDPYAV